MSASQQKESKPGLPTKDNKKIPRIPPPPPPRKYTNPKSSESELTRLDVAYKKSPQKSHEEMGARPKDKSFKSNAASTMKQRADSASASVPEKPMPPVYRSVPERTRVSMNPAGRNSPVPKTQTPDSESSPKKGFMKSLFTKAKDMIWKKDAYAPLDQRESELKPAKKPEKFKKYVQLDEERSTPPKLLPQVETSFMKNIREGFSSSTEGTSDHEAEFQSSGESSHDSEELNLELAVAQPVTTGDVASGVDSNIKMDFSELEDNSQDRAQTEPGDRSLTETQHKATEVNSELCRIQVNTPADIHVAYTVSGTVTTCISYETAASNKNDSESE